MSTTHYCANGKWEPGKAAACSKHERNQDRRSVQMGRIARTKADKAAGVVGKDVGGGVYGDA